MKSIDIPTLRATNVTAVTLETAKLAAQNVYVVTVRESGRAPLRRWHPDEAAALAFAAEQADGLGLLLLDLREPGSQP